MFLLDRSFLRFPTTSYEPIIVAVDVAIAKIVGSNANVREERKDIRDKFSIFLARFVREQSGWFCGSFLHNDLHASPPYPFTFDREVFVPRLSPDKGN